MWMLLLPLVQILVALWLRRHVFWQRYKTLLPSLWIGAALNVAQLVSRPTPYRLTVWSICQCIWLPMWLLQAIEVFRFSCCQLTRRKQAVIACLCLAAGLMFLTVARFGLWGKWDVESWRTFFRAMLMIRQYWYLQLAGTLAALWAYRLREPIAENPQHRAFRTCITLQVVRVFIGSTIVEGGMATAIWNRGAIWAHADAALFLAAIVLTLLQGWWMTSTFSSRDAIRARAAVA